MASLKSERPLPPLDIVGMTSSGLEGLPMAVVRRLFDADIIFTSSRLARLLPDSMREKTRTWPSPFDALLDEIAALREQGGKVVVLATGNPFHYGIGTALVKRFRPEEMRVWPSPSTFTLAATRLGWPLQDVTMFSLHGRAPALIETHLHHGARIICLTDASTLDNVRRRLLLRGLEETRVHLLVGLNGPDERVISFIAREEPNIPDELLRLPHVLALECRAAEESLRKGRRPLPLCAGLPDDSFEHDGQITKAAVRAITISALEPRPHAVLWDIGAGSGSIGIEWLRLAGPRAHAFAIERDARRCDGIRRNADALGTPQLRVICEAAPQALRRLPRPDAVFIGARIADGEIFETAWKALEPGGVLVANAVTVEGEAALHARHASMGGDLQRISTARAAPLAESGDAPQYAAQAGMAETRPVAFRPALSITQWRIRKPFD